MRTFSSDFEPGIALSGLGLGLGLGKAIGCFYLYKRYKHKAWVRINFMIG
jgi:hypothetical protein